MVYQSMRLWALPFRAVAGPLLVDWKWLSHVLLLFWLIRSCFCELILSSWSPHLFDGIQIYSVGWKTLLQSWKLCVVRFWIFLLSILNRFFDLAWNRAWNVGIWNLFCISRWIDRLPKHRLELFRKFSSFCWQAQNIIRWVSFCFRISVQLFRQRVHSAWKKLV